jgi:predicted CXXCH cytochrome family protein
MKQYGIPTDQFANYSTSVHHDAMIVRGDLSAPTCTTCHGNHGAVPPGVDKVQNVCANCHAFQAQMYQQSTHSKAFEKASLPGCVVCHSNHGIHMPSDAMLGTGPGGVCTRCHTPGDRCDGARAAILGNLTQLDGAIKDADTALRLAESAGMEVSEARLSQDQARDALTKARVTIHTFQTALVEKDIQAGMKIAVANQKAGKDAMVERNHRRIGLGICLIAIAMMLVGLWLYIKKLES